MWPGPQPHPHPHPLPLLAVPEPKVWEEEFDLNSVRLCFQASFTQPTGERVQLTPVVSQPIYDNRECRTHTHTGLRGLYHLGSVCRLQISAVSILTTQVTDRHPGS